jgi:hypothetical protein
MLKFIEFALLAVSLLIIFGLVAVSPRTQTPVPKIPETSDTEVSPLPEL